MRVTDPEDAAFADTLRRARDGDPTAFEALVALVDRRLVGFLRARGARDPEDLANEVLVRAFGSIGRFEGGLAQFRAWVFAIARNLLVDERRSEARRPSTTSLEPDRIPDGRVEPDHGDIEQRERVDALLALLTEAQREIVVLRVVAGLTVEETARVVGRTRGAVRVMQHRALARLRREISPGVVTR